MFASIRVYFPQLKKARIAPRLFDLIIF